MEEKKIKGKTVFINKDQKKDRKLQNFTSNVWANHTLNMIINI